MEVGAEGGPEGIEDDVDAFAAVECGRGDEITVDGDEDGLIVI